MTESPALDAALTRRILRHFGLPTDSPPDLAALRRLVDCYTRTVPWESASRIVRRAAQADAEDCFLLGEDFWESHFVRGTGGTCYESNYAFFGLLRRLGYEGYLTINDIGGAAGCHSAIVVMIEGGKYLVDVGFPVHVVLPMRADRPTSGERLSMKYTLAPTDGDQFDLWRDLGSRVHGFVLHDKPVGDAEYRAIGIHDYRHDGGQFLNEIVIQRIVAERLWRFHSDVRPYCLQEFVNGDRRDHMLNRDVAGHLAGKFDLAQDLISAAMEILELEPV